MNLTIWLREMQAPWSGMDQGTTQVTCTNYGSVTVVLLRVNEGPPFGATLRGQRYHAARVRCAACTGVREVHLVEGISGPTFAAECPACQCSTAHTVL